MLSPAMFHYENRGKLGDRLAGPGTGRVKAAPALEPARRGTSSGVLASPRVAKVQACKVRIGPARRGKKAWFPLPLPGVAPIGSAAGPAPPSPGESRPHPRRSATPPSGQERGRELNERNSATLIGLGLDAAPRGRQGAVDGVWTCDTPPPIRIPLKWAGVVTAACKSRARSGCALGGRALLASLTWSQVLLCCEGRLSRPPLTVFTTVK